MEENLSVFSKPILSIIMPCYNVAATFDRAMASILMQEVNFDYEIIIINDASTDDSAQIFNRYVTEYNFVKVFNNGENLGNAMSFYTGLVQAQGDYFCVLDGDDYYTIQNKLQRQIDFFRVDYNEDYVAATHYYVYSIGERIFVPDVPPIEEFNYIDFLTQNSGYYHTSTYMYRNIFKGHVPDYFKEQIFRGDSPRTFFHLMYSNKKVKILNFVGSVYVYDYKGIWSRLDQAKQFQRHIELYTRLKDIVTTDYEKKALNKLIDYWEKNNKNNEGKYSYFSAYTIDEYVAKIQAFTKTFAFKSDGFMFKSFYYSEYLDTLLDTLGYLYRVNNPQYVQGAANKKHIAIVIGKLIPNGGGIFAEIKEMISIYKDYKVFVLLTDANTVSDEAESLLNTYGNVEILHLPQQCDSIMQYISERLIEISPQKAYFYTPHDNPYAIALMHKGVCKNVCVFSFDHGYVCGISSANFDCIIAKRPMDCLMLKKRFGSKVVYIPTWGTHKSKEMQSSYRPFKNHDKLITACAAARFYKVDGSDDLSYVNMVTDMLRKTKGVHYHFGIIPETKMQEIMDNLDKKGVCRDTFINIPWANDLPQALLDHDVDVFIEPFPVVSYKITLEVLSIGLPILAYEGHTRLNKLDFIYSGHLTWRTPDEFVSIVCGLTPEILQEHSQKSICYFNQNHDVNVVAPYFRKEKAFFDVPSVLFVDNTMQEITEFSRVFNLRRHINFEFKHQKPVPHTLAANATPTKPSSITSLLAKLIDHLKRDGLIKTIELVFKRLSRG